MPCIAAVSTPNAAGGIAVIRISGEDALQVADRCFRGISGQKLSDKKGYTAAYGSFVDGETVLDEGVAVVYRAPHSYTGENTAELCCHGGLYVTKRLLRAVLRAGARPAQPGEFTKLAFLNGRIDLAEAEAVMNIIEAQGEQALYAARATLSGSVSRTVGAIADTIKTAAAGIAVWTDYPDEDIPAVSDENLSAVLRDAVSRLQALLDRYDCGKAVTEGVNTVICGRPNVGKSTLMNLLSGHSRSIVTPIAGTTRDIVEETVRVGSIVLRLADTAGLRDTSDEVEKIGVEMAREKMEQAGLLLAVFDGSAPLQEEDESLLRVCKNHTSIAVINKNDLPCAADTEKIREATPYVLSVCAKNTETSQALEAVLAQALGTAGFDSSGEMLAGERQRTCCEQAKAELEQALRALTGGETLDAVGICMDSALRALYALTGKNVSEEVVGEVFARFCVGK